MSQSQLLLIDGGLGHAIRRSGEAARGLEADMPDHVTRLNTDERSVTYLATEIIRLTGWS